MWGCLGGREGRRDGGFEMGIMIVLLSAGE